MKLRTQKGVAAVEFALIITPMLIVCLGITELGRAIFQYDGMVKATRGAARYLTQQDLNDTDTYNAAVMVAKSLAVCGKQTPCAGQPKLVSGLDSESQVTVTRYPNVPTGRGTASLVSVTIGGAGNLAIKFTSVLPGVSWVLDSFSFEPVKITMTYSTT